MGHEANKYFAYARECVRQAEQAQTAERRGKLIELARIWMAAAANEEAIRRKGLSTSSLPRIAS
jgi:ribosomal protein L20